MILLDIWELLMDISEQIFDFLFAKYGARHLESSILCISVYADSEFNHINCFQSWWSIENLALGSKSPATLAESKEGFDEIVQYLVKLSHKNELL